MKRARILSALCLFASGCGRLGFLGVETDAAPENDAPIVDSASRESYAATVLADAPRAYYRLGESSGTTVHDSSGNGDDAVLFVDGTLTLSRPGAIAGDTDTAIFFSGEGNPGSGTHAYAELPAVWPTTWDGDFTVEMFVKPTTQPEPGWSHALFICETYTSNGFRTAIGSDWALKFYTDEGGGTGNFRSTSHVTSGTWSHAAFVRQGTTFEIVLDGVSAGVATMDFITPSAAASCGFGAFHGLPSHVDLDEVAIYERALSVSEIAAHLAAAR